MPIGGIYSPLAIRQVVINTMKYMDFIKHLKDTFKETFLVARQSRFGCCFWLFVPKFWEVVRTLKLSFCSKMNAA